MEQNIDFTKYIALLVEILQFISVPIYQGHRIVFPWFMTSRKQLVRCHLMHKAEKEVSQGKQSEGCTMTEGAVEQAVEQAEDKAN